MKKQLALMSLLLCSNSFNSFSNDNQSVTLPYWQDIQTVKCKPYGASFCIYELC